MLTAIATVQSVVLVVDAHFAAAHAIGSLAGILAARPCLAHAASGSDNTAQARRAPGGYGSSARTDCSTSRRRSPALTGSSARRYAALTGPCFGAPDPAAPAFGSADGSRRSGKRPPTSHAGVDTTGTSHASRVKSPASAVLGIAGPCAWDAAALGAGRKTSRSTANRNPTGAHGSVSVPKLTAATSQPL